ncbi:hypothetical protein [Streptomyces sp. NPDC002537]
MTDALCPGPHHLCKGCRGEGTYHALTLYVSQSGEDGEMSAAHRCPSCRGRGFFCKHTTPCEGKHRSGTPVLGPDALPPV